jgi:hypothetical protein
MNSMTSTAKTMTTIPASLFLALFMSVILLSVGRRPLGHGVGASFTARL